MTLSSRPQLPAARTIAEALAQSEPLARLREQLRASETRFGDILPLLPAPLRPQVRPGPVDETGWTLLAADAATAAKLRHLRPALEARLQKQGQEPSAIRVRVQSV